ALPDKCVIDRSKQPVQPLRSKLKLVAAAIQCGVPIIQPGPSKNKMRTARVRWENLACVAWERKMAWDEGGRSCTLGLNRAPAYPKYLSPAITQPATSEKSGK